MERSRSVVVLLFVGWCFGVIAQDGGEQQTHYGQLINKFNTYHHSVSGYVYSINDKELLIKGFTYDGLGKDAYFWAGATGTGPGPNGFIIPDQYGKTNVLQKSDNKDFTLTLPDNKKITEIKWIAVYDLSRFENFGDVYVPDGFEPPSTIQLPPLISKSDDCSSDQIELIDTKTIKIYGLNLNAADDLEVYFVVGKGHVPTLRTGASTIIPDENGYFEPLKSYTNEDVELVLPGSLTFTDNSVHWLSVYDKKGDKALGYVTIPNNDESSAVPPSLRRNLKYDYTLPNCLALHRDFHVSWDVVGQTITFELVALAGEDDWLGFGMSGSNSSAKMVGADVAIGRLDLRTGQGIVEDFNIDDRAPCSQILEHKRGVCRDQELGKSDGIQVLEGRRVGGALTVIKYRRQLKAGDELDKDYPVDKPVSVIWAVGRMMKTKEPGFHRIYPKHLKTIQFVKPTTSNGGGGGGSVKREEGDLGEGDEAAGLDEGACVPFLLPDPTKRIKPWGPFKIVDAKLRTFNARIGPSAGLRGYEGVSGYANPGYAWYIHGYLTPELYMQRGLTYSFRVEGGNNPHGLETYHPFIITNEPIGGSAANLPQSRILAGVEVTRRGTARPTAAGRSCVWKHLNTDRRFDEKYATFEKFRNTLRIKCDSGEPAILEVTPNSSWPDVVYYHSYTQSNMGWRIHIVDNVKDVRDGGSLLTPPSGSALLFLAVLLCCCCGFSSS